MPASTYLLTSSNFATNGHKPMLITAFVSASGSKRKLGDTGLHFRDDAQGKAKF